MQSRADAIESFKRRARALVESSLSRNTGKIYVGKIRCVHVSRSMYLDMLTTELRLKKPGVDYKISDNWITYDNT